MADRLLLLTSYCGDDNDDCTDDFPCEECLPMCNVMVSNDLSTRDRMTNIGGFGFNRDEIEAEEPSPP